jgi:outer membrane cobalamin receptor
VNRKILCLSAALACSVLARAPLWAQNTAELNEVVVTATRVDSTILESPSAVSVISAAQIAESGATDVAQVINGQPGVVVYDYGAEGATKSVSIRGSTSSQVLVLLDGIRLNSSRDGGVDLSSIPMELIDHIEIVRGGESSLYGSSAIGGVINIVTKKAEKPTISLSVSNESYIPHAANTVSSILTPTPVGANPLDLLDGQNVNLLIEGKLGAVGLNGGASFARAANAFTWNDTAIIDDWRRQTNADTRAGSGFAGVRAPLLGGELSAKAIFETADTGAPGTLLYPSESARQTHASASGAAAWKTDRFLTDALTLDLKGFYRYDELGYTDPSFSTVSLHKTQTASLDATQKLDFSEQVAAIYGGSASYDSVDSTNYSAPHSRLNLAGFLSVPLTPLEILTITPTARYDYYADFAGSLSYSLSAVVHLDDESSLRASFGSAYRVPTLNDMYWGYQFSSATFGGVTYDSIVEANPGLKPETSFNGEVGWSLATKKVSLDATVFARLVYNNIIWLTTDSFDAITLTDTSTTTPENLYETLFPGAEIHGKLMITDAISLEASYTFLYSLLLNDGATALTLSDNRRVPYSPMHSASAQARYTGKLIGIGVELRYLSEQFIDTTNTGANALPGYFLVNADFRFNASDNVALTLAAKNILNALYYTVSGYNSQGFPFDPGYPMPPFSLVTGVSVKL